MFDKNDIRKVLIRGRYMEFTLLETVYYMETYGKKDSEDLKAFRKFIRDELEKLVEQGERLQKEGITPYKADVVNAISKEEAERRLKEES